MKFYFAVKSAAVALLLSTSVNAASSDAIGRLQIRVPGRQPEIVLNKALSDVREIFRNYHPALDSSTTIKSPVVVSGSSTRPFMEVTLEKCVLVICRTVEMKADISVRDASGRCDKNYLLRADLTRSSEILSGIYDALDVTVCFEKNGDGQGILTFDAAAHHAAGYAQGPVQSEIFKLLKLQLDPIGTATKKVLKVFAQEL